MDVTQWITLPQQWNNWSFIASFIQAVRRPCAVLNCLCAAIFGSRCWGGAWKKESSESDRLSRQPCARLIRNTWLDCVHQLTRSAEMAHCVERRRLPSQRGVAKGALNPAQNLTQKFQLLRARRNRIAEFFVTTDPISLCEGTHRKTFLRRGH